MAGLALGGATSNNLRLSKITARRALIKVQFAVVIYCGLLSLILTLPIPAPALTFPLLALLAGSLAGAAFPLALMLMPGGSGQEAGSLYAADLLGGCFGALLGAVLFVPVLGIPQTCVAITLVALGGALALIGQ
jgi:spermidine synthase